MDIEEGLYLYREAFKAESTLADLIEYINKSNISDEEAKPLKIKLAQLMASIELDFGKGIKEKFPEIEDEINKELEEHGKLKR